MRIYIDSKQKIGSLYIIYIIYGTEGQYKDIEDKITNLHVFFFFFFIYITCITFLIATYNMWCIEKVLQFVFAIT
jgi:hypothetical protein